MATLFLFIPNYTFTSDLLYTDFIKLLSDKYRVVVFSPVFTQENISKYHQSPNIEYIPWWAEYPRFWLFFTKTLRISLIREFDNLKYFQFRNKFKVNLNWKRRLLKLMSWFIPRPFLTADFFTKLEKWFLPNSKKFREHVKKYGPSLILTATPGFHPIESEAIIMAKKNGLKTASIDSSWDNYTSNALQLRKTDYLICWNKVMKDEAMRIHRYSDKNVFVSGIYRFDHHFQNKESTISREKFLKSKNLDPARKTLFLSTVPPNTYPAQYDVWQSLLAMQRNNEFAEPVNLFFRLHPNDKMEKYAAFKNIPNVHVELAGQKLDFTGGTRGAIEINKGDLENLRHSLRYMDVNINFRSSISLEATIYDKPVINLALHDYSTHYQMDHYIPIMKTCGVKLVSKDDDLRNAVNVYLKNPSDDHEGRKAIFDSYISFRDGRSSQRSVEAIGDILSQVVQA